MARMFSLYSPLIFLALFSVSSISFAQSKVNSEENEYSARHESQNEKSDAEDKSPDPVAVAPAKNLVPAALVQLGDGEFYSPYAFVVDKSTRTLTVWKAGEKGLELVTIHPTDIGRKPGNKLTLGDHKTPEGLYFFDQVLEAQQLNFDEYGERAFTTDYPNFFDKLEKKTGNGIWLHGIPDKKSLKRGSRGCVVVRNKVVKTFSPYVQVGKTPIVIADKVEWVAAPEIENKRTSILKWLENWRSSWENKNLDQYMSFYGDEFKSMKMDKAKWRAFKKGLNEKYQYIKVKTVQPYAIAHGDEVIIRFLQEYESDHKTDSGEKFLYLKRKGNDFKIVGEEWKPLNGPSPAIATTKSDTTSSSN